MSTTSVSAEGEGPGLVIPRAAADQYQRVNPTAFSHVFGPDDARQAAALAAEHEAHRGQLAAQFTPDIDWGNPLRTPGNRHHRRRGDKTQVRVRDLLRRIREEAALTLMLAAVLFIPAAALILSPGLAQADPADDYIVANGITAVCEPLDADPSIDMVIEIGGRLGALGLADTAGRIVADSVAVFCPHHMPLLERSTSNLPTFV